MLRLRGNQRSSFGRLFTPRKSNGSDEDNSDVANTAEGLASFRSSPLRNASERVASMGTALNQARDWIATNRLPNDEQVDQDHDGYLTDGENADAEPVSHDVVEHLMLEACEQISQHTESGKISLVSGDSGPSKTKFITSINVTERRRPPRSKRVNKTEDNDGEEEEGLFKPLSSDDEEEKDLFTPLPRRGRPKPRIKVTYQNDMKHDAKVKANGKGSTRSLRRPLNSHENSKATGYLPPRIRNGILHANKTKTSRDKRSRMKNKRGEPTSSSDVTNSSSEESNKASTRSSTHSSKNSDGKKANRRDTSLHDKCFSRYPADKRKIDLHKKALPFKDLTQLAKDLYKDQGLGKSFLDNIFKKVYEVITKDQKAFLSLLDLESNILHYLQRNGIISREEITGLSIDNAFAKKNSVLEAAKQRTLAADTIIPQSQKNDQKHHHGKATTASEEEVKALLQEHFDAMEKMGLGDMGSDTYQIPRIVSDHVDFFNWHQKRMADAIFHIVKELSKMNEEKPNSEFGAINVIMRTLETLTESTRNLYRPQPGVLITPLDSVIGTTYLGYEARLALLKTKKTSLVTDKLPEQIQLQLLGLPQGSLTEEIGAYAASQVYLKAVNQLSEKNPIRQTILFLPLLSLIKTYTAC